MRGLFQNVSLRSRAFHRRCFVGVLGLANGQSRSPGLCLSGHAHLAGFLVLGVGAVSNVDVVTLRQTVFCPCPADRSGGLANPAALDVTADRRATKAAQRSQDLQQGNPLLPSVRVDRRSSCSSVLPPIILRHSVVEAFHLPFILLGGGIFRPDTVRPEPAPLQSVIAATNAS